MNRRGATARARISLVEWDAVASGGGTVLSATGPRDRSEDQDTLLRAHDTRDGHLAWQLRVPTGREYGVSKIAAGRVSVVRRLSLTEADAGRRIRADLLILDAGTRRLLHTLRLPTMTARDDGDYFMKLDVRDIADGR